MGVVGMEDFPYYAFGRYPSGARRVPIYNSSFPGQWSGDYSPYYDNSVYGGTSVPLFVVEAPFAGDANVVRKRKQDGLKGEVISSGEHNARNARVENVFKSGASSSSSKPVLSPSVSSSKATQATRLPESRQVHSAESRQTSSSSAERSSSHPRVISVPVISVDEGKDNIVNCTVMPKEGTKKLREAMSVERAAVLIQARFRGTQVRSTQPLAQLRQIAKVKSEIVELDEKASDADFINYALENTAARMKLTEGIMKLLLELDAIQGAHPTVREIRKLATKEVISLQGRVDVLFSTDASPVEQSQLPMETEQASGGDTNREMVTATESSVNDLTATPMVDLEEETRMQVAEPDPDQERNEVVAAVGSLASVALLATRADEVSAIETNNSLSRTMVEPDPDQGNGDVGESETVDIKSEEINTSDEGVAQSGNVSVTSPQESLQRNEEEMEEIDDRINGNLEHIDCDLSGDDVGDVVHPFNEKGSILPYSPRSPFDDFPSSNSDSELQSELQASRETIEDGSTEGKADTQALLLKLSEENKSLKSLLITVMKWNQMQATTMQELNHRLGKLESKTLSKIDKKSNSRRRGYSKSSRMML